MLDVWMSTGGSADFSLRCQLWGVCGGWGWGGASGGSFAFRPISEAGLF